MSIRHALLALLSEGPRYGLQLRQEFEARTGEVWPLNVGQVYTTLHRLERDGFVESEGSGGPQNVYTITPPGADELAAWLRTPPDVLPPPRDELVIKVLVAIGVPGVDVPELLQVHRRHMVEAMQEYTHLKGDMAEGDVELGLVVDSELFRIEAIVRWLDAADARLKGLASQPRRTPAPAPRLGRLRVGSRR
jgi:DNA-binding PadR family transcriptional regulator